MADSARASLVMQEYRYAISQDAAVKALYSGAREIVIETNLNATDATALATAIFNSTKAFAREFELEVEAVFYLEDWIDGPPRFTVSFDRHPAAGTGVTYRVVAAKIDYPVGRTTLTVRS